MKAPLFLTIATAVLLSNPSWADLDSKWIQLNQLLNEEIHTIKSVKGRMGPTLKYRLFELYSEKIGLIKQQENRVFLNADPDFRRKLGKAYYFRASLVQYKLAQAFGPKVIREHSRYIKIPYIYYTLALNSRDYGNDTRTEEFLGMTLKTLKNSKKAAAHFLLVHQAKTTLAEYYYNKKKYHLAIRYYRHVLQNKKDEWHSKHHLNVSWCYLKVKNFKRAIFHIKRSYFLGRLPRYLSVESQVLDGLGIFHVIARKVREGARFYLKHVADPGAFLIKMAKSTADKGLFRDTRYLLHEALSAARKGINRNTEIGIRLAELGIYRNFARLDLFFETSRKLQAINRQTPLQEGHRVEACNKIKGLVGYLQIKLAKRAAKRATKNATNQLKFDLVRIIQYFDILGSIDPKNRDSYHFFKGESYFSVGEFLKAAGAYKQGLEFCKKSPTKSTLRRKILGSLMASIAKGGFKSKLRFSYTVYAYENHLDFWPVDEKSRIIYGKLFNLFIPRKKLKKAIATMERYSNNYPEDTKLQRGMLTRVMDRHIADKNSQQLAHWIKKLERGHLSFETAYIKKATAILGKILFSKYQKLELCGKRVEAVAGYISLYENPAYPRQIVANAALSASLLYLDSDRGKDSFKWMALALKHFEDPEIFKIRNKLLAMLERHTLIQDFDRAIWIAGFMMDRFCKKSFREKSVFYRHLVHLNLVEGRTSRAMAEFSREKKCGIGHKVSVRVGEGLVDHLVKFNRLDFLTKFLRQKGTSPVSVEHLVNTLIAMYWQDSNQKIKKLLQGLAQKHPRIKDKVVALGAFEDFQNSAGLLTDQELSAPNATFNEQEFNHQLESHLKNLKKLTDASAPFLKSGEAQMVVGAYIALQRPYRHMAGIIRSYRPKGVTAPFMREFARQMGKLAAGLEAVANSYEKAAEKLVSRHEILISRVLNRYPASWLAIPMDTLGPVRKRGTP